MIHRMMDEMVFHTLKVLALATMWTWVSLLITPAHAQSSRNANYTIKARLNPDSRTIEGTVFLHWRNIQQEPAHDLCFHLYYNAWRNPESTWMLERSLEQPPAEVKEIPPDEWAFIDVLSLNELPIGGVGPPLNLMKNIRFISPDDHNPKDRTVMKVDLNHPVNPGEEIQMALTFRSRVPRTFARTGFRGRYFLIAQWFPKLGVWMPDGTWNCHQFHASTEFFSDYGIYDVELTVPEGYVTGATGVLQKKKKNPDRTVTWVFHQKDVHDFAWVTSPELLEANDLFQHPNLPAVQIRLLYQPEHKAQVPRMLKAVKAALEKYGLWYGPYPYNHLTVVDPAYGSKTGGMEYPTFFTAGTRFWNPLGGGSPESVTIHEFGHQIWYGVVGSNEFEHAWMDEGLNTFSTGRVLYEVDGPPAFVKRYFKGFVPVLIRNIVERRSTYRLHEYRPSARSDIPSTPSYLYFPETGRNITYSKTALWLYTLEKYLGWPTLKRIMSEFYRRYQFAHPEPEDFFHVAEEISGQDLRWFFDQVYRSNALFDYEVSQVSSYPVPDWPPTTDKYRNHVGKRRKLYRSVVVVRRNGDGIFPVEVRLVFTGGKTIVRPWDGRNPWIQFQFLQPEKLVYAMVDPREVLALDLYRVNNGKYVESHARFPAWKWALKWTVWLQHLMLTAVSYQ